ncbi:MAG: arsenosugar biosynthesis radical SAM (seleno)protein ArsS [Bacteriovoracia bacterium]
MESFKEKIETSGQNLSPISIETLQINITSLCNQACHHCHVDASPKRREMMSEQGIDRILSILSLNPQIKCLDITGGAPELHPGFRKVVHQAKLLSKKVIVRHNLTVTFDPHPLTGNSMEDLPEFFAKEEVELISSLPCYGEYLTDKQRGVGVFDKSIRGLRRLNEMGYGMKENLPLNLVYNPSGENLPPPQESLEREYKKELMNSYGITFNRLYTLTNMPINRFKKDLARSGHLETYMNKLHSAFNVKAVAGVMCRSMVSVSWDGRLYDCDFNQMLGMKIDGIDLEGFDVERLLQRQIKTADHCYGCTAGAGSSCGGTIT